MPNNELAKQFTPGAILRFTLPNMIMMVFMALYTIVDGMFISRFVGSIALSATNMFYPVTSIQIAIGVMLATGGSAVIAWKLGMDEQREAKEDFTCITATAILIGLLTAAICLTFQEEILLKLGTSPAQMPDALVYGRIMLYFSPMMFLQMLFQVFFVTAGKPHLGLGLTVLGGIANMILDYLFMGPMAMGSAGAAIATGISYCIPAVAGLFYFLFVRTGTLYFVRFTVRPKMLLRTCANGSSEMVTNAAIAVTTFLFNVIFMRFWQEDGVAAITILLYYQYVFSSVFMGFAMGIAPIISFKYGAGDEPQLKTLFKTGFGFVLLCSVGVYLVAMLTMRMSLSVFTEYGGPVYNLAMEGFAIFAVQFLFMGVSIFSSGVFTAFGNGVVSALISLSRTFIFLVGSLLILPELLGEFGVWSAVPVAEFLGLLVSIRFLCWGRRRYRY